MNNTNDALNAFDGLHVRLLSTEIQQHPLVVKYIQ